MRKGYCSAHVVAALVHLVTHGILGGGGAATDRCVVVLGNLLVGFFAGGCTRALYGLRDVVGGVPEGMVLAV